ncbi:hypothetical protein [Pseudoclavibacter helvolus]|uniref:hypothetical protein n=1 Tax=Pseudoclavibacter helvolus TaxID=255205 RepID=UPI003C70E24E
MTASTTPRGRRRLPAPGLGTRILAGIGIAGLLAGAGLLAADSAEAAPTPVTGVALSWPLNDEVGGGAYFGGCNFLSAGTAGNHGTSAVWADDALYSARDGGVTITKPDAAGTQVPATWDTRCQDAAGTTVGTAPGSSSANQVNLAEGSGTIDLETGTASISWEGAFTVVFYGGMTYWSIEDLTLTLTNGTGTLTGTASGYGADMDDPTTWEPLPPRAVTLATISVTPAELNASGATITPDYQRVDAGSVSTPQAKTGDWGSWPKDFVAFHESTGQASYWYSSGGMADPKKIAAPMTLQFDTSPSATPAYERVPLGSTGGLRIGFANLGTDRSGQAVLRARDGSELPVHDGGTALIANGVGAGVWDISGLALGTHEYTLHLRDGASETPVELADEQPLRINVVTPLDATATPILALDDATSTSFAVNLDWPGAAGGPPTSYRLQLAQGDTPIGAPTQVPAGADGSATTTITAGLAANTQYSLTATPYLATAAGASATTTVTTAAAPAPAPSPTPAPTTPPSTAPTTPADPPGDSADGATFFWGLNKEATSGAFYGGCNFLSAGQASDTGSSRLWTADDYRSADGNVTIIKPVGAEFQQASWATKCVDRTGANVSTARLGSYTESQVRITGGETTRNGSQLTVQWRGSFTVAFYGGLSYWTATDPVLKVDANGNGTITATGSGYGASMTDSSKWVPLAERTITLATLTGINTSGDVFTITPDYLGVSYDGTGQSQGVVGGDEGTASGQAARTALNSSYWGAFPADFIDFQKETGLFSYWFTSNGARDAYKPTLPLTVSLAGEHTPATGTYTAPSAPTLTQPNSSTGARTPNPAAPPTTTPTSAPAAAATGSGGAAPAASDPIASASDASGLRIGEISAPMLLGGGAGLLAVAGLNWSISLIVRRRLGLDPNLFG